MSLLVVPNTFTNGTGPANIIDATQMNANFTAVATAVNNIYPSQILPITSGQATFGATATGVGYKFLANDATAVPLTISGVSGQSVDILDVTLTSGGTKAFYVDSSGIGHFTESAFFSNSGSTSNSLQIGNSSASQVALQNDGAATNGMSFNVPTSSTNGFRLFVNAATLLAQISANGVIYAANGTSGLAPGGIGAGVAGIQVGSANAATKAMDYGNGLGAGRFSRIGSLGDTINTIVGTVFEIADSSAGALITVDASGNMGGAGSTHFTSLREAKKNIAPLSFDPLALITGTEWRQWQYKHESDEKQPHVGFIADEASEWFSGKTHNYGIASDMAGIALAGIKDLTLKLRAAGIAI